MSLPGSAVSQERGARRAPGVAARRAGILLVLTAAATVIAVVGRVSAGADQPVLVDSLAAVAGAAWLYGAGGAGRLVSGLTLIAAAWYLPRIDPVAPRPATPVAAGLLSASGACTAASGAYAMLMAVAVRGVADPGALAAAAVSLEVTARLRPLLGAVGFMLAGWALILVGLRQRRDEGAWRRLAPVTAVLGVAMQLIWIDAATVVHRVTGIVFTLWLVAAGVLLWSARSEPQEPVSG